MTGAPDVNISLLSPGYWEEGLTWIRSAFKSLAPTLAVEGHLLPAIIELNGIKMLSLNRTWPADSTTGREAKGVMLWLWRFTRVVITVSRTQSPNNTVCKAETSFFPFLIKKNDPDHFQWKQGRTSCCFGAKDFFLPRYQVLHCSGIAEQW